MDAERITVLKSLLQCRDNIDTLTHDLAKFSWDSEPLIFLTVEDLKKVLEKYLSKRISINHLEKWANIIESREDIAFDPAKEDVIKDVVFNLANAGINHPITDGIIHEMITQISA